MEFYYKTDCGEDCDECGSPITEKRLVRLGSRRLTYEEMELADDFEEYVPAFYCADCLREAVRLLGLDVSAYKWASGEEPSWIMNTEALTRWAGITSREGKA